MLVKCICTNCAGHLEFEQENAGEEIECPHCGFDTKLFLPGTEPDAPERSGSLRKLWGRRKPLLIAASFSILACIGFAMYRWVLGPLKDWLPYTESKLLPVLALGANCAKSIVTREGVQRALKGYVVPEVWLPWGEWIKT